MWILLITLCASLPGEDQCKQYEAGMRFQTKEQCSDYGQRKIEQAPPQVDGYSIYVQEGKCVRELKKDEV